MRKLVVIAVLVVPSLAMAQVKQQPKPPKTIINFGEATIESGRDKPIGCYWHARPDAKFKSLIQLRESFDDKVSASVEDLR